MQRLDRDVDDTTELRVFCLCNADPEELVEQLSQLFPDDTVTSSYQGQARFSFDGPPPPGSDSGGAAAASLQSDGSERRQKLGRVLAVADSRASSLVVSAASSRMPQIAALIKQLDADPGRKEGMHFWDLRNADPQNMKQLLQELFNRNITAQNNNNSNPLLGQSNPLTIRQTQQQTTITTGGLKLGNSGTSGATGSSAGF